MRYSYLSPFAVLGLFGAAVYWGWLTQRVTWVQPRSFDAPLPANACAALILIGVIPFILAAGWKRTSLALSALVFVIGAATAYEGARNANLQLDNLLVEHESLVAGKNIGRMPVMLAVFFAVIGLMLAWLTLQRIAASRPLLLALLGSLCAAYGLAGLLSTGLSAVEFWQLYARIAPHTAAILIVLGGALMVLATHDSRYGPEDTPRWLWLPIVVCSVTVTFTFWIALRQRELAYTNDRTLLTGRNIATLFLAESLERVNDVKMMARQWARTTNNQTDWEADTSEYTTSSIDIYRSVQRVDINLRTVWLWPKKGNEEIPFYDHATDPMRRRAVDAVRENLAAIKQDFSPAIAGPLDSPLQQGPTFAVYAPTMNRGRFDGFIVGELYYGRLLETVAARLSETLSGYLLKVTISNPLAKDETQRELTVFELAPPDEGVDERLRITSVYQDITNQKFTITLTPRPGFVSANRQGLSELALFSGLGVSVLFGLVVNLAQSARLRQRSAERTSEQLLEENEERRRVEERLKATDERLNLALDSTQVGVYEWDVESDQMYCTPSVWKIIGYDAAAMPATGQGWLNLLPEHDRAVVRDVIEAHFIGDTPFIELERCIPHRNGEWIWIALRAKCTSFSAARRPLRVLGTIQNINARKLADDALRVSQAESRKLSLVASKTDNAVIITDELGRIEWVNESYIRLTGRRLADVANRPLVDLLADPEGASGVVGRISAALAAREAITTDVVQITITDRPFHVHLDVQPVVNEDGGIENFIAIETDITSRVETEQQLRRAKTEADAASRAKSEFLASMSHEIRTPMNGVIGMTSLMLETDVTPEQRDYLNTIRTSGDALLSIINEILDFSKIESGKMELETQPFELTQCVEEAIDIFALQAAAKNIELAYHIAPSVPRSIIGDITRLRQVLVNLINNAIKFTASGFVTIEIATLPATPKAPIPAGSIRLNFRVTDTGIGIPAERLSLLFKPFSQVDSSTTRKYGGTGLGLAICDRLCQLMGGSIAVESTAGKGSCFHFNILTSAVNTADSDAPAVFTQLPAGHVLVVDDHPVNRAALRDALPAWSITPHLAANSEDALRYAKDRPLAAAIVDHNLAGTPGIELIAKLRAIAPNLPVVLYIGAAESARRTDKSDPRTFRLPKPIKPFALHETLRHVLSGVVSNSSSAPLTANATVRLSETIPLDILLVEDNLVNQKVALRFLNRMGYTADCVANGIEAVQAATKRNYQLVLMDVQMPEMDGYEATREIRAKLLPENQPIIIALTANAMQGDRERCLAAGMNDYITKPMKIDELQLTVLRYFGNKVPA